VRTKNLHFAKATFPGFSAAVFFYVRYGVSYRDLEEIMEERGVNVDHATLNRWVMPKALAAVALSFCRLLGLGCPKQAFAKIATPRIKNNVLGKMSPFKTDHNLIL
jgi:hypothetical protein